MKTKTLKQRILWAFTGIIVFLGICILGLGFYVIKKDIFERTQTRVVRSLESARIFYEEEINRIGESLISANLDDDTEVLKKKVHLDYFYRIPIEQAAQNPSLLVREAVAKAKPLGGTRIIDKTELADMSQGVQQRSRIKIENTPKARPAGAMVLESAMAKEYVLPIHDENGKIVQVVYAGKVINQDNVLVDRIRKLVFGDELYNDKPVGTVTIFQDDVRISTNVLDEKGQRAIGTRISEEVYHAVVEQNHRWLDRAFVVTHWYKTAYEPIRNIHGEIIGILYVGILEEPYNDMATRVLLAFLVVIVLASMMAFILAYILSRSISHPLTMLLDGTRKLSGGELGHLIWPTRSNIKEMQSLAKAFNDMSVRLEERDVRLQANTAKLEELNKSYLDLLGFVAHELKGLLSSAVINAYSLRDGFLGMINFKQKKAVDSICRNLDYLDATVKKFLNLSRLERGNLEINKTKFAIGRDVFETSIQTFAQLARSKCIQIKNEIDPSLIVTADMDLMLIVANNLVNNAIKYGLEDGQIRISADETDEWVTIEVYNDSIPIRPDMVGQLFKKFSRLNTPEKNKVKGTGLGLYITKQIVEAHGGNIRVEAKENGNSFIFTLRKES